MISSLIITSKLYKYINSHSSCWYVHPINQRNHVSKRERYHWLPQSHNRINPLISLPPKGMQEKFALKVLLWLYTYSERQEKYQYM